MRNVLRQFYFLAILAFILTSCAEKQEIIVDFPRSTPESEGISSQAIIDFIDAAEKSSTEFHSFMIIRHGNVVAEGWWNPYAPDLKHTMYSTSKSFTSTAIGFAVSEGLLSVTDKVMSFFPDDLPDNVSPNLAKLEVRHLLFMSAGQDPDPTGTITRNDENWIKAFLATPIINEPGSVFLYNSMASFMLSAIVQKVTGEKVIDYLKPRLFDPLNIKGYDWEVNPQGINTGGWGLRIKTEDMAKFGQLLLQKGKWNGKQVIPEAWVDEATTAKIDQKPDATDEERANNSWVQGYAYQYWRCRHNAFRADGAFGQYIIVMPDQDAVVVIQAESPNMQEEINLVWDYLLPGMQAGQLPADKIKLDELNAKLKQLALAVPEPCSDNASLEWINGKKIELDNNYLGWQSLLISTGDDAGTTLTIGQNNTAYPIQLGFGEWQYGTTNKLGPNLLLGALSHHEGIAEEKIAAAYTCDEDGAITITLRYVETPHTETISLIPHDQNMDIKVEHSQSPGAIPVFSGHVVN